MAYTHIIPTTHEGTTITSAPVRDAQASIPGRRISRKEAIRLNLGVMRRAERERRLRGGR